MERERASREISDARIEGMEMLNRTYDPPAELPGGIHWVVRTRGTTEKSVLESGMG